MNWLTADLPGIGGHYKRCPDDFFVEEIPLYACSGEGEHLYLQIEKRQLTTLQMLTAIADALKLSSREIGYAGLKDAQAVTRQWVSLPAYCEKNLARLNQLPFMIRNATRHANKLRLGHLAGNRFCLRIRQPVAQAKQQADRILDRLQTEGVPNRFGEQRYGLFANSHRLGQLLLNGAYTQFCQELMGDPERIENPSWKRAAALFRQGDIAAAAQKLPPKMGDEKRLLNMLASGRPVKYAVLALPKRLLRLYLSALQSWLFDQLLEQRLPHLGQLQEGDLALKHANGACFLVQDVALEQARAERFEISPTAPLFGHKIRLAEGVPGTCERALLKQTNLRPESWKLGGGLTMNGERRALRVPLSAVSTMKIGDDLQLNFSLPSGSYATSVLDELIKQKSPSIPPLFPFKS